MHQERRCAAERVISLRTRWPLVAGVLGCHEVGYVQAAPAPCVLVPPDQLLPFTPGGSIRARGGAVVQDAAVGGPRECPPMSQVIARLPLVRTVPAGFRINPRVDPAPARCGAVAFELSEPRHQAAVRDAPAVDLLEHLLRAWLVVASVGRVVPRQRVQARVAGPWIARGLLLQSPTEVKREPRVAPRVARRIDRLFTPLHETLRVREAAFLFSVTRGGQKEDFGLDVFGAQLAALDLRRVVPEAGRLDLDEVAHDEPIEVGQGAALEPRVGCADGRVLAEHEEPFDPSVGHLEPVALVRMIAAYARQPVESIVGRLGSGVSIPRLQQADDVLVDVLPPPGIGAVLPDVLSER